MRFILRPEENEPTGQMGGKARALAELRRAGLPIPAWCVVSPEAFTASLTPAQQKALETVEDGGALAELVACVRPNEEVRQELMLALAELCPNGEPVAVRSSASDEDGAQHSFAGQWDSFLFVRPEEGAEKVAAVWRSGFSERILAYRREHGLPLTPRPPSVLIQRMVNAEVAGVAFGADPVTGRRGVAVVSAVYGLGTALVSGESDADTYLVARDDEILQQTVAEKRIAHRYAPDSAEGVASVPVPEAEARRPALNYAQVRAVAELARRAGKHFGRPQDIEWAIEGGKLYLLQSRPITTLTELADPDGVRNLWDNSNITESYSGVTTPLTFSFALRAYTEVYRQLCRMLRVSESAIAAHDDTFRHMLGLIRGRVYYNLLNWYRLLALLPGFSVNRRFMEQMMGVREGLPDDILAEIGTSTRGERLRDAFRLAGTLGGMALNYLLLPYQIKRFYARLDTALAPPDPPLEDRRPDELAAYYRDLERQLLTRWDAPLVNDLFAMIFYGVLGKMTQKRYGDTDGALQNELVRGQGGMISAEPARRVQAMAQVAAKHPAFVTTLCHGSLDAILPAIETVPEFKTLYRAYLDRFGDRCLEELKLESPTLHDDPLPLLRAVGNLAFRPPGPSPSEGEGPGVRVDASNLAPLSLRRRGVGGEVAPTPYEGGGRGEVLTPNAQRLTPNLGLFPWILRNARARVRDRENLRFERTRLFGRVRRVFVEIGKRFCALDLLEAPRDIFYLEVEEILGFISGTATCTDLKGLVALRKAEFAGYREPPAPDDRFETFGIVYQGNAFRGATAATEGTQSEDERKGIGCCPGIVRGPVRVITDPRTAELAPGTILVAERTDPGWVLLFPAASGLLVERGSLLSHSAIVAREMGLPAIVSLPGVTRWLKDGDTVEMDGSTGVVRRIQEAQDHAQ